MIRNRLLLPRKFEKVVGYTLFTFSIIWLGPMLACGSFAPRPTPVPTSLPVSQAETEAQTAIQGGGLPADGTQIDNGQQVQTEQPSIPATAVPPTPTPLPGPTAIPTPLPAPGTALLVGQPARVTAPNGLNVRELPQTSGQQLTRLGRGILVSVIDGPTSADGFTWWKIDDGEGTVGWSADGDENTEWISPRIGEPQPTNRAPRIGDRVLVTTPNTQQLTIRSFPGTGAPIVIRVDQGGEYTVTAGPQEANTYTWYRIRSDDGTVEGWAADGNNDGRWLSPLE